MFGGFLPGKALTFLMMEVFTRESDDDSTGNLSWISIKVSQFPNNCFSCWCFKCLGNRWERNFGTSERVLY